MSENIVAVTVAVLGLALALGCVLMALGAVLTLRWYRTQLSLALELVIRHQDRDMEYVRKATTDATAAARTPPIAAKGGTQSTPANLADLAAQRLLASEVRDGEDMQ
jgi:hypothetical protein